MSPEPDPSVSYRLARPYLDSALESYRQLINDGLRALLDDFYVTGRVKTARSLLRKMRKGGPQERTWESIQDKVGLRVICSTKEDVKRADRWIQQAELTVIEREVKKSHHDRLYYPGTHFIVADESLRDHIGAVVPCEIQLRTRAQDAWSVVSHKLLYKGLIDPPTKIKRVIARLTVVVEMFDDEVQRMMRRRRKLPVYRPAMMLEYLDQKYETVSGVSGDTPLDFELISTLIGSYSASEIASFETLIDDFCASNEDVGRIISSHQPNEDAYVDSRDWLFSQPEILMVLERSAAKPFLLLDAVQATDIEDVVRRSCISARSPLPQL